MGDELLEKTAREYEAKISSQRNAEAEEKAKLREDELCRSAGLSRGVAAFAARLKLRTD